MLPHAAVNMEPCNALILAAGRSRRMGLPKPFLACGPKLCFLQRILEEYRRFGCAKVAVVVNEGFEREYRSRDGTFLGGAATVVNRSLDKGRFFSVKTGMLALGTERCCFVHDVDLPLVDTAIMTALYRLRGAGTYVVPRYDGRGGHPILLGPGVARVIAGSADEDNLREVLGRCERVDVDVDSAAVVSSVNTPEEYTRLFGAAPATV